MPVVSKRVVVDFPEPLYRQAERGAAELKTNRSGFIRLAVQKLVSELQQKKLEKELADGYIAMAAVSQQVAEDFKHIDSEWD